MEPRNEIRAYAKARVPKLQPPETLDAWEKQADQIRRGMLDQVVFRGKAAQWRDAKTKVQWFETLEGDADYHIRKFRYEALPGFWVPALLYEPTKLSGKMPVFINVNGHHPGGKAMPYKQRRCINLAKRGILAFNLEFIHMGQLRVEENNHFGLPQIDLCGTSGVAPFILTMTRGLDIALTHEHADPTRVGVAGLSGGGWQSIFLASLDTRITLANPVAGYSSMFARIRAARDVGDSEQAPADMCTVADYTHLTALVAPRPMLLTYNAKDNCCFLPTNALPEIEGAAQPIYRLYGHEDYFRTHVNHDPGTHNFEQDNREALYRLIGDHFFAGDTSFDSTDLPVPDEEIKTEDQLAVPMPENNATLNSLALDLSQSLPRNSVLPKGEKSARAWQQTAGKRLQEILRYEPYKAAAQQVKQAKADGVAITHWRIRLNDSWTVPVVELSPPNPRSTVLLLGDEGRATLAETADRRLALGQRVLAVDLLGFGETKGNIKNEGMFIAAVGKRQLGIQAAQLAAVARWASEKHENAAATVLAFGPRNSTIALMAAAVEPDSIAGVHLHGTWGSLKELIQKNLTIRNAPEMFCFGLLQEFDIPQLIALVAPRPVVVHDAKEEVRSQLGTLQSWYATLGTDFDPLK